MILNKTNIIVFLVGVFLGLCTGFFVGKGIYDQPLEENIVGQNKIAGKVINSWNTFVKVDELIEQAYRRGEKITLEIV